MLNMMLLLHTFIHSFIHQVLIKYLLGTELEDTRVSKKPSVYLHGVDNLAGKRGSTIVRYGDTMAGRKSGIYGHTPRNIT